MGLSIVIPCYNVENYINKTIGDLYNNLKIKFEVIAIDDFSTDSTLNKLESLKQEYKNIKIIRNKENIGQGESRNKGIEKALFDWVMFLDADDCINHEINTIISHLDDSIDIFLFGFNFVYSNYKNIKNVRSSMNEGLFSNYEIFKNLYDNIPWSYFSCVGSKIYRRKFIIDNNLRFKKMFNEDGLFALESIENAKKVYLSNDIFYNYFQHENSIMHSFNIKNYYDENTVIEYNNLIFKNLKMEDIKSKYIKERRYNLIFRSLSKSAKYSSLCEYLKTAKKIKNKETIVLLDEVAKNSSLKIRVIILLTIYLNIPTYIYLRIKS